MAAEYLSEHRTSHGERLLGEGSQAWGGGLGLSCPVIQSICTRVKCLQPHFSFSLHLLCSLGFSTLYASSLWCSLPASRREFQYPDCSRAWWGFLFATSYHVGWRRKRQPIPVLLPGKSHRWLPYLGSIGSQRVRHDWATWLYHVGTPDQGLWPPRWFFCPSL